ERLTGSQEVRGSIPLVSTIVNARPLNRVAFFICKILPAAAVVANFATTAAQKVAQLPSRFCTKFVSQT
ncbi:hypothetical protein, partial [Collinsella aerofaciens]|uniref:hypothetical protein n=1 Tax=Collinsella aerofaciens TaxID=74426 RepID=UPI001E60A87A